MVNAYFPTDSDKTTGRLKGTIVTRQNIFTYTYKSVEELHSYEFGTTGKFDYHTQDYILSNLESTIRAPSSPLLKLIGEAMF